MELGMNFVPLRTQNIKIWLLVDVFLTLLSSAQLLLKLNQALF